MPPFFSKPTLRTDSPLFFPPEKSPAFSPLGWTPSPGKGSCSPHPHISFRFMRLLLFFSELSQRDFSPFSGKSCVMPLPFLPHAVNNSSLLGCFSTPPDKFLKIVSFPPYVVGDAPASFPSWGAFLPQVVLPLFSPTITRCLLALH